MIEITAHEQAFARARIIPVAVLERMRCEVRKAMTATTAVQDEARK